MRLKILLILAIVIICWLAFFHEGITDAIFIEEVETQLEFDPERWNIEKGWGYAYRNAMLADLMSDPEVRALPEQELVALLGEPTRKNGDYLYYTVDQKRAIILPLHTKTLVIKMNQDTIEWMKIHE